MLAYIEALYRQVVIRRLWRPTTMHLQIQKGKQKISLCFDEW